MLIIGAACSLSLLEVANEVGGAIWLAEPGLPHAAVPVPAHAQEMGDAQPLSSRRPAPWFQPISDP